MATAPALSLAEKQARFEYLTSKLVIECALADVSIVCYRHRATFETEAAYFKQGLSQIDPAKTPTMHMKGLAKDYFLVKDGKDDWQDVATYTRFGEIAESIGLKWGGRWKTLKDFGHVEYMEEAAL